MRVEIWSDIACPWCYIGKARFEKGLAEFAHRDDVEVVHRSFELDPDRAKGDVGPVIPMLAKKYGRTIEEARAMEANVASNAHAEGLGYLADGRDHGNTFDIHRLLHLAKARGRQTSCSTSPTGPTSPRSAPSSTPRSWWSSPSRPVWTPTRSVRSSPTRTRTPTRCAPTSGRRPSSAPNAVPFFVLDRKYGISGGQPAEVFTQALDQAWQAHTPALKTIDGRRGGLRPRRVRGAAAEAAARFIRVA